MWLMMTVGEERRGKVAKDYSLLRGGGPYGIRDNWGKKSGPLGRSSFKWHDGSTARMAGTVKKWFAEHKWAPLIAYGILWSLAVLVVAVMR